MESVFSSKKMMKGLVVFASHTVEDQVLECLGSTRVPHERTRFENGYAVSKHNIKGHVYNVAVIRGMNSVTRAVQLANKLGGGLVFLVYSQNEIDEHRSPMPPNVKMISSVAAAVEAFQLRLSPTECEQLKSILEKDHVAVTMRNYVNPETPGDAEQQFANRFFSAAGRGRHVRAPDSDLFQGAIYFLPAGRVAVVHNSSSDEDSDFLLAQHLSLQEEQPTPSSSSSSSRGIKRLRKTPPAWESVLKQAEPITPGLPACVACHSNRASICFDCGHQVMCDECVRQMCQLPGVRRACPVCRCESETILRPILSEVEK